MAKKEGRQPQYDTPVIRDELFGFLVRYRTLKALSEICTDLYLFCLQVAGHDTTSITVCWGLKFLTAYQQAQVRSLGYTFIC